MGKTNTIEGTDLKATPERTKAFNRGKSDAENGSNHCPYKENDLIECWQQGYDSRFCSDNEYNDY